MAKEIHFIIGPALKDTYETIKDSASYIIHGNGDQSIDLETFSSIEQDSTVILCCHGISHANDILLSLEKASDKTPEYFTPGICFSSFKHSVNLELRSCHSGHAVTHAPYLPAGSTLITFVNKNHISSTSITQILNRESLKFTMPDNIFVRFASYILTNPDDLALVVRSEDGLKASMIITSIATIQDYSIE